MPLGPEALRKEGQILICGTITNGKMAFLLADERVVTCGCDSPFPPASHLPFKLFLGVLWDADNYNGRGKQEHPLNLTLPDEVIRNSHHAVTV